MAVQPSLRDWSSLLPALRDSLAAAAAPLTASALRKSLAAKKKPDAKELEALLDEAATRGECHRWEPTKGKTPRYWMRSPETVARPRLLESLATADEPLTTDEHRKRVQFDAPLALVQRLLDELAAEGRCRRYEPLKKGQFRYWAGDPDRYARRVVLGVLAKGKGKSAGPLSWAELAKALRTSLKDYSEDHLSRLLQELLDSGQAFKALTLAPGAVRYTTRPPDLVALVREAFADVYKRFAKVGISQDQVNDAARSFLGVLPQPSPPDLGAAVLKAFADLKRERYGHSGLVPIPEVRRSIGATVSPDAARHDVLDDVIKGLVREGKLSIIPLNDGTGISDADCNDAIPGIQETWFYLESRA